MSFFEELKRRNVFRVGIAYVLLGWALLQGADFTLDLVGAPEWVIRALTVVVAIGLPIALFFAWAFEALELSILGQFERALAFDFGGYPRWSWADRFVEARTLPAFQEKVEKANLPELWDAIGPPPACRKTANGSDCANRGTP